MGFFHTIGDRIGSVGWYLGKVGDWFRGVPLVSGVASYFDDIESKANSAKYYFERADDEFEDVKRAVGNILSWSTIRSKILVEWDILKKSWSDVTRYVDSKIAALSDIVDHTWSEVTGMVNAAIAGLSDIVDHTWSEVTTAISTAIDALPGWAKKTFSDATDDFILAFQNKFAASETRAVAFLTALGIGAGDVITTILDTPAAMFLWIRSEIEKAYDIVLHTWSEVTGMVNAAIEGLSDIVDHTWSEVTGMVDAAIAGLSDIVDHTWSEVTGMVDAAIAGLSDIVDHTWSEVTGMVNAAIAGLSDIVDHTWSEVTGMVDAAIAGLSDIVDHTWSEVTGVVDAATEQTKAWFDEQEEKVYGWISEKWVDKILDIIDGQIDHYKDKLWNLFEKVLEKL